MRCATCHRATNFEAPGVPGNPKWKLAPIEMAWQGKTLGEICRQILDPSRSHMTRAELLHHMAEDELVGWAWHPGGNREPAPGSQADADREIADLTNVLGEECGTNCFIVVSDATAAYNDRYGIQRLEDYELYADALASSPSWEVYSSGATSRVYRLVAQDGGA